MRAASGSFDVLVTVDRNLQYQQNTSSLEIGVIILVAGGITYNHLRPMMPQLEQALKTIGSGEIIEIGKPKT